MPHRRVVLAALLAAASLALPASGQTPKQPKVQPGPSEPDWVALLDRLYGLRMFDDLLNPVVTTPVATPGLFRKAGPGPVVFTPLLALGLDVPIHGGFYSPGKEEPTVQELWQYKHKSTARDIEAGSDLNPPLKEGSKTTFDPGGEPFGLWIGNDQFGDRVFSQPSLVASSNARLAKQPYKAMIYPYKDGKTGKIVPNSFLIGWEYSTNDDFQDVVCRIENVELVR